MPIKKMTAPKESVALSHDWAAKRAGRKRAAKSRSEEDEGALLSHAVYHASAADLASAQGLKNARQVAWRHFHYHPKEGYVAHEIRIGDQPGEHHFSAVHAGQMVEQMRALGPTIESLQELEKDNYEVALLRLSALKTVAIWLRGSQRKNDYLIPLKPCFHGLVAGQLYTSKDFLAIVKKVARAYQKHAVSQSADDMKGG
ncbi:MAG: hypothetical protein IT260_06190 [Saprospiraceae bacterium]|nr:hypothetical protein [Saprospiraceae bacterium]